MVAVPEARPDAPAVPVGPPRPPAVPALERRVVAVSVDATELLRPESDLVQLAAGARYVDVLLAREVGAVESAPLGMLAGAREPAPLFAEASTVADGIDDGPGGPDDDDPDDEPADDVRALLADVALLAGPEVHVHRLGLPGVAGAQAESDLVAALSELVGFDPEPGVHLLGPAGGGPERAVVQRAVQRVAQVYGIPVRRYRCLELTVVDTAG